MVALLPPLTLQAPLPVKVTRLLCTGTMNWMPLTCCAQGVPVMLSESIGGVAYLASLTEGLPRRPSIKDYICIVKEKRNLRVVIGQCQEAIAKAEAQSTTASDIVKSLGIGLKGIKKS